MPISFDGKTGEFGACVAHFTAKGKSKESASSICGKLQKQQEKENKFCAFGKLELKETKEDFHVSGFVATSHPDRAVSEDGQFVGDIIPKSTLQKIASDINNKYLPQAGAVSERHDHLKGDPDAPEAGVLTPNTTATLQELEDGEWGVHVDTILSKTNPRYEDVKTNIEQGVYPGFSIEYANTEFVPTEKEGKMYRLLTNLDTEGFGYASRRKIANPHAEYTDFGYKEIKSTKVKEMEETEIKALHDIQEDKKKAEEAKKKKKKGEKMEKEKAQKIIDGLEGKERKEIEAKLVEADIPDAMIKELLPVEGEDTPAKPDKPAEPDTPAAKEYPVSKAEHELLTKFKEQQTKEAEMKKLQPMIAEKVKAEMKERGFREAPVFTNDAEGKPEFKEFNTYVNSATRMKEFDDALSGRDIKANNPKIQGIYKNTINQQYKEAGALANSLMAKGIDIWGNWKKRGIQPQAPADLVPFPQRNLGEGSALKEVNGRIEAKEFHRLKVEMKAGEGLQVDTNLSDPNDAWTYGSYFLSPVELNDIFQPVLINQLNDQTTTFGSLTKEDWSGRSQIQFRARTAQNSTVGGYEEGVNLTYGTSFTGTVGRDKFQQPFAYYRVLIAVTGQMMRLAQAPGGMGDVWADEIKWSGVDLLSKGGTKGTAATGLNLAVLGSGAGTAENIALGFEGLILGTSGTLYGKALSNFATLRSHKEDMSSVRIKLGQLRKMIRDVETGTGTGASQIHSNSREGDLAFYCHHLQRDFIKGLIQDMQRLVPTSARVGFEGEVEFDGVPVRADRQIDTDDVFLINHAHTKIAMNLPPTLEPLPVTADAQAAHIKAYWNLYSDAPGNNYWAHTFAVS